MGPARSGAQSRRCRGATSGVSKAGGAESAQKARNAGWPEERRTEERTGRTNPARGVPPARRATARACRGGAPRETAGGPPRDDGQRCVVWVWTSAHPTPRQLTTDDATDWAAPLPRRAARPRANTHWRVRN